MLRFHGVLTQHKRRFSSSTLSNFNWLHRGQEWEYSYTVLNPDHNIDAKATFVLFPSTTLLTTREEWRECAGFLTGMGYRCILIDWPGWHQRNIPLNWALEEDVNDRTLVSAFTHFAYSALKHFDVSYSDVPLHLAVCGGNSAIHIRRALQEANMDSPTRFKSISCFSPTWRFYLSRYVPEGYPRKFARRQAIAEAVLDGCFVRSKNMFRLYKSKVGLSKLTKRLYEEPVHCHPERFESKKEVITRDRPLSIDAAMITGRFDPVSSTEQFISELFGIHSSQSSNEGSVSDDDEDDDNLLSIKVPQWAKNGSTDEAPGSISSSTAESDIAVHLVIPEDAVNKDKSEMRIVSDWANHHDATVSSIPGRLFCHEESPALSASLLDEFVSTKSKVTQDEKKRTYAQID